MTSTTTHVTNLSPYRWVILLMSWAAFTMTSVDRSTWGPASASVGESLAIPLAALGTFATAYYIGYVLSNLGGGFLVDWLGGRLIMGVSGIGAGLCMFLFGSTTSVAMGLAIHGPGATGRCRLCRRIETDLHLVPRGEAGLRGGRFRDCHFAGHRDRQRRCAQRHPPFRLGHLLPRLRVDHPIGVGCLLIVRNGTTTPGAERTVRELPDVRPLLRNRNLLLLGLAGFGGLWGTYGFVTWSNTLMVKGSGISPVKAGIVLVVFASIAVFIKPAMGWICDRIGRGLRLPTIIILAVFSATLILFGSMNTFVGFLLVARSWASAPTPTRP